MTGCCAVECKGKSKVRLFAIPSGKRNEERRKIWLHRIGRKNFVATRSTRLCMKHFSESQFEQKRADGRKKLKPNAIPDIFDHRPQCKPRKPPAKRLTTNYDDIISLSEVQQDRTNEIQHEMPETSQEELMESHIYGVESINESDSPASQLINSENCTYHIQQIANLERAINRKDKKISSLTKSLHQQDENLRKFLNPDQCLFLQNSVGNRNRWSDETIAKALRIRLSCGSKGYQVVAQLGQPLPSERTLQRRIQHLKFQPGILTEVFEALKIKVETMKEEEKHVVLMLDEMAITPGLDFDTSVCTIIGHDTLRSNACTPELATHVLVLMIGGLTTRSKQVIGYHFTGKSSSGIDLKNFVFEAIICCENVGLTVNCVVSDMGPCNQSMWKVCGICVGRYSRTVNFCVHPANKNRRLFFTPDVPHILKNIWNHMAGKEDKIYLPQFVIDKYQLPSNEVSIDHVKNLLKIDQNNDLKLAPLLKESVIKPSHFEKMKVGLAISLFNQSTSAAINVAVEMGKLPQCSLTTGWFCARMHKWFKVMSSRTRKLALSMSNEAVYRDTIYFLNETSKMFEEIRIGKGIQWKPIQSGVILSVKTAVDMSRLYIEENRMGFLLLSRLSQDALENLFSTVRSSNPVPNAYAFKKILRLISLAQFFRPSEMGNCEISEFEYLLNFFNDSKLCQIQNNSQNNSTLQESTSDCEISDDIDKEEYADPIDDECLKTFVENKNEDSTLSIQEQQSLYYLAGNIVARIKISTVICKKCEESILLKTSEIDHAMVLLMHLTNFKKYSLNTENAPEINVVFVNKLVFQLFLETEKLIRRNEQLILRTKYTFNDIIQNPVIKNMEAYFPKCHSLHFKLMKQFFKTRIYFLLRKFNKSNEIKKSAKCDSKSVGMRIAIKNL